MFNSHKCVDLGFANEGLFLNISCYAPRQTLLLVLLPLQCKETQLCQLLRDLRQITHLTFLGFPSFIFKMGATKSTLWCCDGEEKKLTLNAKVTVKCNVLNQYKVYYCFINPNGLLRNLYLM